MRADGDQLAMATLRHSLVAALAKDRDLLDVACGSGYALPLIARNARSVTGCDRDAVNIRDARQALPSGSFCVCDAGRLPLRDHSVDVVACLEAIYYFADWRGFVRDTARILRPAGALIASWPSPERPAFSRSPNSTAYPRVAQMLAAAREAGIGGTCYGAFPLNALTTGRRPWLNAIRGAVVRLHLMPNSLRLRAVVKRAVYRRTTPLSRVSLLADPFQDLVELTPGAEADFAMLYFVGTKTREVGR
jgi:SAM-dependent methyltransferase